MGRVATRTHQQGGGVANFIQRLTVYMPSTANALTLSISKSVASSHHQ